MAEAGISPRDALVSATQTNARILGISDRYGSLEPGKQADLMLLTENPLENIRALSKPKAVYQAGQLVAPR